MNIITFIVTPLSGAVIGYFTNWLAIKMLFRPHQEKRVFGIKLPFTPGLLPKERFNLSSKLGKTLSANVLTPEVLQKSVSSPEMSAKISELLDGAIDRLYNNDKTISECVAALTGTEPDLPVISGFLCAKARDLLNSPALFSALADKPLRELLRMEDAETAYDAPKAYIKQNLPAVLQWLKQTLETSDGLRAFVKSVAEENVNKLLGIFINYDKLYDSIKEKMFVYLEKEENQDLLLDKLAACVDGFIDDAELHSRVVKKLYSLVYDEVDKNLEAFIGKYTDAIFSMRVSDIMLRFPRSRLDAFKEKTQKGILTAVTLGGGYIVGALEFDKIAEQKINEFSIAEAESIIFSIVKRELNSITVVGGVLGFIIGLVPVILSLLGLS